MQAASRCRPRTVLRQTGRVPDPFASLLTDPPDLPVPPRLYVLQRAIAETGTAVLQSPPGSGKTTLVPPALAAIASGRVIVTQPRRIAARAAAARLAFLIDEPVGGLVGFAVRGERKVSRSTRVEVVTAGVLLRRLQRDPDLPGVDAVVLDEVHERHVESDLALAMLVDVRATLRADLALVAMSATVEADRVAAALGAHTPVVNVPGALHPVETAWCPPPATAARLAPGGTTTGFLAHVAQTTARATGEQAGDALVFLPGVREVDDVVRRLRTDGTLPKGTDVLALHGRLSPAQQDRALRPGAGRRVVVSTAVAESSLTVPGVRIVVDAGLARAPQTDHRRGLAGLVTRSASRAAADQRAGRAGREAPGGRIVGDAGLARAPQTEHLRGLAGLVTRSASRAAAEQRAGRAGREAPGVVYRCWSQAEHAQFDPHTTPQIHTADLTSTLLELARWGAPRGEGMNLLDPPPAAAVNAAETTLAALGAIDAEGTITTRGQQIAELGIDPRLARALLDGAREVGPRRAADVVAALEQDVPAPGGDIGRAHV